MQAVHGSVGRRTQAVKMARLLTAVVLLGIALLLVVLVGQVAAGAKEQVPRTRPEPAPSLLAAQPADAEVAQASTPALRKALQNGRDVLAQSGASLPTPQETPTPPGQRGDLNPHWERALQSREPEVAIPSAEVKSGNGDNPYLPPGAVRAAGPAAGTADQPRSFSLFKPSTWFGGTSSTQTQLSTEQAKPAGGQKDIQFERGAMLPKLDAAGNKVLPWNQGAVTQDRRTGALVTRDGSRVEQDGRVILAPQGDPIPHPADSMQYKLYASGVEDYTSSDGSIQRWVPDGPVWIYPQAIRIAEGEIQRDGSLLRDNGDRWYTDGTKLVNGDWELWGGLHINQDNKLLNADGTEIPVGADPYWVGHGVRVRKDPGTGSLVIDFANGDSGLAGGVRRTSAQMRAASQPGEPPAEQAAPLASLSRQELQQQAERLEQRIDDFWYQKLRLNERPGAASVQQDTEWTALHEQLGADRAELGKIRKILPSRPDLDGVPDADLVSRAAALREQIGALRQQMKGVANLPAGAQPPGLEDLIRKLRENPVIRQAEPDAPRQPDSADRAWQNVPLEQQENQLLREHDHITQKVWAELETVRQQKAALGPLPDPTKQASWDTGTQETWDRFSALDAREQQLQQAFKAGTAFQSHPWHLGGHPQLYAERVAEARSLWAELTADQQRLAELSGPASAESSPQYLALESRIRQLQKQYDDLRWSMPDSQDLPTPPLRGPEPQQKLKQGSSLEDPTAAETQQASADEQPEQGKTPQAELAPQGVQAGQPGPATLDALQPQDAVHQPPANVQVQAPGSGLELSSAAVVTEDGDHGADVNLTEYSPNAGDHDSGTDSPVVMDDTGYTDFDNSFASFNV